MNRRFGTKTIFALMSFVAVAVFATAERRAISGEVLGMIGFAVVSTTVVAAYLFSKSILLALAAGFSIGSLWGSVQVYAIAETLRDSEGDLGDTAISLILVGAGSVMLLAAVLVGLPVIRALIDEEEDEASSGKRKQRCQGKRRDEPVWNWE